MSQLREKESIEELKIEFNKKIEEIKNYYESILALMPGHVYWQDKNNVFLGCNDAQAKSAALKSRKEIVGKTNYDMIWRDQAGELDCINNQVIKEGKAYVVEEHANMALGPAIFLTEKVPLRNEKQQIIGTLGISFDITERKKQEEELRLAKEKAEVANQAKSNFLAMVSHELRTPLNVMLGLSQILKNQIDLPSQKNLLDTILHSGESLIAIINDILDFSKLEAGKLSINKAAFNLKKLIDEIMFGVHAQITHKDIFLTAHIDSKISQWLFADKFRLRQVLVNLLSNAVKFTPQGRITLDIKCLSMKENHADLKITVTDTGIGIPEDRLVDIFDRFTQINSDYSRPYTGMGLGLAISRQLVEVMGGEMGVVSEEKKGSVFWFTLQVGLIDHVSQARETEIKLRTDTMEYLPLLTRVLLVEDNALNQLVAKVMLQDLGCDVGVVDNGEEAIAQYQRENYDVILTDISLPNMDGFSVIKQIQTSEKYQQRPIPIIALTAHGLSEDRQRCLEAGACDVLVKPILQLQLYEILNRYTK